MSSNFDEDAPIYYCYICGKYTTPINRRNMTLKIQDLYQKYFGCHIGDQDKPWAPHFCCTTCYLALWKWGNGKQSCLSFAVPMIWREPTNHATNCYFCLTKIDEITKKLVQQ